MFPIGVVFLFGLVMGMFLIAYEDNVPCALFHKLGCIFGWHGIKHNKRRKYYCKYCKKPRKHPKLKVVDGGTKIGDNPFKR